MAAMDPNTIDAVVTDPPYHLTSIVKRFGGENAAPAKHGTDGAFARASRGFMGQTWDGGDIAFRPETWAEVYRVMKPGAHLVAFGGTRTFHRMMVAIEDAGFEHRDMLMWVYGTGFPKSHDVSKGIDKHLGVSGSRGAPKLLPNGKEHHFNIGFGEGAGYASEAADRFAYVPGSLDAAEWQGWGTALKPSYEPIALFRKPLEKGLTVAQNVLKWGTGALNIDGCRIGDEIRVNPPAGNKPGGNSFNMSVVGMPQDAESQTTVGRWPANLIHDGSDAVISAFPVQSGESPARFFYSAKAGKADRAGSKHPTVKPVVLMQWLVRMITPLGGRVLDPFAGSGTTGAAAELEGFDAVLCEQSAEYVADIRRRFGQEEIAAEPAPGAANDDIEAILAEFA